MAISQKGKITEFSNAMDNFIPQNDLLKAFEGTMIINAAVCDDGTKSDLVVATLVKKGFATQEVTHSKSGTKVTFSLTEAQKPNAHVPMTSGVALDGTKLSRYVNVIQLVSDLVKKGLLSFENFTDRTKLDLESTYQAKNVRLVSFQVHLKKAKDDSQIVVVKVLDVPTPKATTKTKKQVVNA